MGAQNCEKNPAELGKASSRNQARTRRPMAFEGIVTSDQQKEDMAVSLAVLLLKDGEKELTVRP